MRFATVAALIPFLVGVSVIAMVACAPKEQMVPVQIVPRTALGQALFDCAQSISERKPLQLKERSVKICQVKTTAPKPEASATPHAAQVNPNKANPASEYEIVERPISYRVENHGGRLAIKLDVGVHLPQTLPKSLKLNKTFQDICVAKIRNIWRRSSVDLVIKFTNMNLYPNENVDQHLTLVAGDLSGSFPRLAMAEYPDRAFLYPNGTDQDQKACLGKTGRELESCEINRLQISNNDFCVNLAMMVGHWAGLEQAEITTAGAGACKPGAELMQAKTESAEAASPSYMKPGLTSVEQNKFWQSGRLSGSDLKAIFAPVCSSFKTGPDIEKTSLAAK